MLQAPPPLAFIQIQCSVKAMHCVFTLELCMYVCLSVASLLNCCCCAGREAYTAVQYPDLMSSDDVRDWWAPYQRKYVTDFTTSGAHTKPGNGGFFHHCCERKICLASSYRDVM